MIEALILAPERSAAMPSGSLQFLKLFELPEPKRAGVPETRAAYGKFLCP